MIFVLGMTACIPTPTVQPVTTLLPTSAPTQAQPTAVPSPAATATEAPVEPLVTNTPEFALPADAANFPDPAGFAWQPVVAGLALPVDLADPGDGSGRLLVLEQKGKVRIVQNGQLLAEPFLDLTDRVGADASERGLLGIALAPDFLNSGVFYLNYTSLNGSTHVSRFRMRADVFAGDPASEQVLLNIQQPYVNHNGGGIAFGPDGYLYIGMGDGGSGGDPQGNAQNMDSLLGKMLRIDVSGSEAVYSIPSDNPFADGGVGRQEIWASGLRNPWRFSFDRQTGDLYMGDVGQNKWEEINYLPAGSAPGVNFGWDYREGANPFEGRVPKDLALTDPVWEYGRDTGCSVTGGVVARDANLPEFAGIYLFSDYCQGTVFGMLRSPAGEWQVQKLFETGGNVSSFGQGASGEVYLLDHRTGTIYLLVRK